MTYPIEKTTYDPRTRELKGPKGKRRTLSPGRDKFIMCLLKRGPDELAPKDELVLAFGNEKNVCSFKKKLRDTMKKVDSSLDIETKYAKGYILKGVIELIEDPQ
ncbi:MAG TPA: hypothetical protein VIP81_25230 [Chitinophaga sp.]